MKLAIVTSRPDNLAAISGAVAATGARHEIETALDGIGALPALAARFQPDALILEIAGNDPAELDLLAAVASDRPTMATIVLCASQSPAFLIRAMRLGVRDVLPAPVTREALSAALARLETVTGASASTKPGGTVLTFIGCKGGSGATFLATNLAVTLAERGSRVALFDFNLQFGDAIHYVHDHRPATDLADVARNIGRLDAALLMASLQPITPNFGVLASPDDPGKAADVRPEHVEPLVALARELFDFVIIDLGRSLDPVSLRVLDQSDKIYPVMQMMLPGVRNASRMLSVFRSLEYPADRIEVIVNRYERDPRMELPDLKRVLGVETLRTIPNSYRPVSDSINQGVPIGRLSRSGSVARTLAELATSLLPQRGEAGTWFGRLLRRA